MGRPDALPWIVGILAWQSYRVIGFKMIAAKKLECHGGDLFPTAWVLPLGQDGIINWQLGQLMRDTNQPQMEVSLILRCILLGGSPGHSRGPDWAGARRWAE